MPGIQINSLQDLLMLRELKNQANPTFSAMQALSGGIAAGIAEEQARAKQAKKDAEEFAQFQSLGQRDSTNSNIIQEASFEPGVGIKRKFKLEGRGAKATRIKAESEVAAGKRIEDTIRDFNRTGSTLTITDLTNAGIKASEAEKLEEQRVPISQDRDALQQGFNAAQSFELPQVSTGQITTSGGSVIPKRGPSGRSLGSTDIGAKTAIETAAAEVQVAKEVRSQQEKAGELAERGVQRAASASKTAFDEVLRFNDENFKKFRIKPGAGFGFLEKLQPEQLNRYKAAATGAGREAAATVGTQIIPAARAVRMVEIFAKSTAEVGNTIEGNAANAAASMANVWGNALSTNFEIEMKDGTKARLKDVVNDPETGQPLSEIQFPEIFDAIGRATEEFKLKTEKFYLDKAFDKNKRLLQDETVLQIESDRRKERIAELRSRQ